MTVVAATLPFVSNQVQGALQQSVMQAVPDAGRVVGPSRNV